MDSRAVYEIDGERFSTLEEFFEEIGRVLLPGIEWGHNLDAFNDILRGGFGMPDEGFILYWKNSQLSKIRLGYNETARQLTLRLKTCHPGTHQEIVESINQAQSQTGPTIFDSLIATIQHHCKGGALESDCIELILE